MPKAYMKTPQIGDNCYYVSIDVKRLTCCKHGLMQLDVPIEYQENGFSCVPVCILMVLKYLKDRFSAGFPNLDLDTISEAIKTDEGGTAFEKVKNINELFKKTSPSWRLFQISDVNLRK
jgi:hypothetical protein